MKDEADALRRGDVVLARGLRYARSQLGTARVRPVVARGAAVQVLREFGRGAEMVVAGCRGYGAARDVPLGSVPWQLAGHGSGTVVVVRGLWRPVNKSPGMIAAGVDGSAAQAVLQPRTARRSRRRPPRATGSGCRVPGPGCGSGRRTPR